MLMNGERRSSLIGPAWSEMVELATLAKRARHESAYGCTSLPPNLCLSCHLF